MASTIVGSPWRTAISLSWDSSVSRPAFKPAVKAAATFYTSMFSNDVIVFMGRIASVGSVYGSGHDVTNDLFRFTAPGERDHALVGGAYASIDNGVTSLNPLDAAAVPSDCASSEPDLAGRRRRDGGAWLQADASGPGVRRGRPAVILALLIAALAAGVVCGVWLLDFLIYA
jgi:hypothetical protein